MVLFTLRTDSPLTVIMEAGLTERHPFVNGKTDRNISLFSAGLDQPRKATPVATVEGE